VPSSRRHWREQLRHDVATVIREQILTRQARPGDILRLGPIAEEVGTSITPVREALLMLAHDGWLVQEPNVGFRVQPTRRSDIQDIYLMWSFAEGELCARAAGAVTPAGVKQLREIDAQLHALAAGPQDGPVAYNLNQQLHGTIYRIADAPKLEWFRDAASRLVPYEFPNSFWTVPNWWKLNRDDHTPIIDAIESKDADTARAKGREHLVKSGELLMSWLEFISFFDGEEPGTPQAAS
jgi:DNA-binding GntR family transcriptional regulator